MMDFKGHSRKALFRAALALREMNQESWAAQEKITPGHLTHVLNGRYDSEKLTRKIDAFIAEVFPGVEVGAA